MSTSVEEFRSWFAERFSLNGEPYTLDLDQAKAVLDSHKNTLITARAGSGKTRVIVAKIAYLLATSQAKPSEIVAFMFNRAAAAEVNQRISKVKFDNQPVAPESVHIASTFHKFALDVMKLSGAEPQLISEADRDHIIERSLRHALTKLDQHVPKREFDELFKIISGFIARAGQKYAGPEGLKQLRLAVKQYVNASIENLDIQAEQSYNPASLDKTRLHEIALMTFEEYLANLRSPRLDFNIMMFEASEILRTAAKDHANPARKNPVLARTAPLKFILIDEYQDFSQLFLNLVQSLRENCPAAHLFAVGDDWQAINRFAGSDIDYFINFAEYFPEDATNIPLLTNYRSRRRIVENANQYMLKNYDPSASRAVPFSRKSGKIIRRNYEKIRFDASDIREDAFGDARYQLALANAVDTAMNVKLDPLSIPLSTAQLLKATFKILRKHRHSELLLLHRHNFTTFPSVTLEVFYQALKSLALEEGIMDCETFKRKVRCMTIHKSKGLEAEIVILLEANRELILGHHPNADLWKLFGDSSVIEKSDQHRLLYVAMTRAKQRLYILSTDKKSPL